MRIITVILFIFFTSTSVKAQTTFSLATDVSVQRSFKDSQKYWTVGQTVEGIFHFTKVDAAYAWLVYYTNGKFNNELTAPAKSLSTIPSSINYRNNAELRFKEISLGWRHYFNGGADAESGLSVYGYGGFGVIFGRVNNTHSVAIDTSLYQVPVLAGAANFKRLTLDLGLGTEYPLGGDIFIYGDARVYIPASDYPSRYLFVNNNAPYTASLNLGLRILFN